MGFIDRVADRWVDKAISGSYIQQEDREIYRYGFRLGVLSSLINMAIFAFSFLLGTPIPTLMYLLFYSPLRSYAGGIHAASRKVCFCSSVGMYLLINVISRIPIVTVPVGLVAGLVAMVVVWALAPVEDPNKPLSQNEIVHYGRFARILLILESIAVAIMVYVSADPLTILFSCYAVVAVAVLVVLGRIKNHKRVVANGA